MLQTLLVHACIRWRKLQPSHSLCDGQIDFIKMAWTPRNKHANPGEFKSVQLSNVIISTWLVDPTGFAGLGSTGYFVGIPPSWHLPQSAFPPFSIADLLRFYQIFLDFLKFLAVFSSICLSFLNFFNILRVCKKEIAPAVRTRSARLQVKHTNHSARHTLSESGGAQRVLYTVLSFASNLNWRQNFQTGFWGGGHSNW
jgi:hypothetical protein